MKKLTIIFLLLLNGTMSLLSQDFITKWTFDVPSSILRIEANTDGPVNYTWTTSPSNNSGSGTFENTSLIENLVVNSGDVLTLSISPDNLIKFRAGASWPLLTEVTQWGAVNWEGMSEMFYRCENLEITATDIPNTSASTSMFRMFYDCNNLTGPVNIGSWDVSSVEDMQSLFNGATNFNQDISSWDVSSVTEMSQMFAGASSFNQDISSWNTINVERMGGMFTNATAFNQNISGWDTGLVTNFIGMFANATAFNQDISGWDVSAAPFFTAMFNGATAFNQNLGAWTLSQSPFGLFMFLMFDDSGMDCQNYSQTLIGWETNNPTIEDAELTATNIEYGLDAVAARTNLINNQGWTISGDIALTVNCIQALPVEWLNPLTAELENEKTTLLNFATASETNNSHFEIQHSNSGRDFQSIGTMEGHGNSTSENHYQFIHKKPNKGTNYYRVKQVDYDGQYDYSNIAVVSHKPRSIIFYPNPTTDNINLLLSETKQVTIYTALGVVLDRLELEAGDQELFLKKYGQSILLLQVGEEWLRVVVE